MATTKPKKSPKSPARSGAAKNVIFHAGDIGSELLSLLSEGLYSNPLDALREYVQNAVDAKASSITVKFTGSAVTIRDDGDGMTIAQLHEARKFAVSPKRISQSVGFRGIGIYSGFNLCKRMIITTKAERTSQEREMSFDFEAMRKTIERQRNLPAKSRTSLLKLLSAHVTLRSYTSRANTSVSFTAVQLQDVSELHYGLISDHKKLKEYFVKTVPVDFDDNFEGKDQVNEWLKHYAKPYKPVKLDLLYDGRDAIPVRREMPQPLQEPKLRFVGPEEHPTAIIWSCLTAGRGNIAANRTKLGGFVYKRKGFTIGSRDLLHKHFSYGSGTIFYWYIGEVVVLDDKVIPNAARDDFERTDHFNTFVSGLEKELKALQKDGDDYRKRKAFETAIDDAKKELPRLREKVATAIDLSVRRDIEVVATSLAEARTKLPARIASARLKEYNETLKELRNLASLLQKRLVLADNKTPKQQAADRAAATTAATELAEDSGDSGSDVTLQAFIAQVLESDGVEERRLLDIVAEAVDDILSDYPEIYERVVVSVRDAVADVS